MNVSLLKCDLDAIGYPSYPGTYPPFYLVDYCEKILLDLEKMPETERKIRLLVGLADNMFRLGISKGSTAMKDKVIANLFS